MSFPAGDFRTTTHFYRKSDLLGIGSSCDVYTGIQKVTGELHALKIFKDALWASSEERRREVAALRRLQHPNIIKFFGEEEEAGTGRVVLVLELCKEGSLHTFLHEPCNSHGLDDKEFLLLIGHLSAGLHHLYRHKYVHRDIKPGNILRYVELDGSCNYKLSDFGASKLLDEGELFMSLAGTEEYLHPLVYEKAFVDRGAVICFDSSVDLWSVGCTLYQAATCQIPFRPHGGVRNNRTVMFQMIAQKQSGVISGHQTTENGPITWERHIPSSARLSPPLKAETRNLICRLLENEQALLISHEHFQQKVQMMLNQIQIVIFHVEEVAIVIIYIKPNCSLAEFQDHVAGKTDVMAGDQLLFHRGQMMSDLTADGATVDSLSCDISDPIILLTKSDTDSTTKEPNPLDTPPPYETGASIQKDCEVTHKMAVYLYDVSQRISNLVNLQTFSQQACVCMIYHLEKRHFHVESIFVRVSTRLREIRARQETVEDLESRRVKVTKEHNSSLMQRSRSVQSALPKLQSEIHRMKESLTSSKDMKKSLTIHIACSLKCSDKCVSKSQSLYKRARDIWRETYSRKKNQPLSDRNQLCHIRDMRTMEELVMSGKSLIEDHCLPNWRGVLAQLKQRVERFHAMEANLDSMIEKLTHLKYSMESLDSTLTQISAFSGRAWNEVTDQLRTLRRDLATGDATAVSVRKQLEENKDSLDSLLRSLPEVDTIPDMHFEKVGKG